MSLYAVWMKTQLASQAKQVAKYEMMFKPSLIEFGMEILERELENDSGSEQHSRMLELIYSLPFFQIQSAVFATLRACNHITTNCAPGTYHQYPFLI